MTIEPRHPVLPRPVGPSVGALLSLGLAVALAACSGGAPDGEAPEGTPGTPGAADTTAEAPSGAPSADTAPAAADPEPPSFWAYTCPDGLRFSVHLRPEEASVYLPASEPRLAPAEAGPGVRFASGDTVFHARGAEALLEVGAERHPGCAGEEATSSRDAARRLGFDFRGVGQEPGWIVDVDVDRQVRWVGQYGTERFATGAPEVLEDAEGRLVWRATADGRELRVEAVEEGCRDAMSGQPFSHVVRVRVDGEELDGCGGFLEGSGGP